MRRTEDEFRRQKWVDEVMLFCYVFFGAILFYMAVKAL